MESILTMLSGALLLTLLAVRDVSGQDAAGERTRDEAAIRQVVATYVETWNRNDMTAWGRLFTDDVDYVNRAGGWWKSNRENVEGHRVIHDALARRGAKTALQAEVGKISFLAPDIALVHVETSGPGVTPAGEAKELKGVITAIMVNRGGRWLIRALQNTLVEPVPLPGRTS